MLDIVLIGLNHKTAPVELRECLAFSEEDSNRSAEYFQNSLSVGEVIVISTCNRVELLMAAAQAGEAVETAKRFISESKRMPVSRFESALYMHEGNEAVRHVFRVASSLDSLVVGETQILGQIKEAYRKATERKTSGVLLNRLLHKTFFVAKRVRHETGIGDHAVSISYAAIELAKKIFGDLEGKGALLVGAGEMAELAVEHLIRNRAGDIYVANRTFSRAVELARRFDGTPIRLEELPDAMEKVDIIIGSTGAPGFVVQKDQVKSLMRKRKNRPLFFIDIAVPRDIDPEINNVSNAYVYDIDDLKGVIEENIEDRKREAVKAERIIDEAVIRFAKWRESLDIVPTIVDLRKKFDGIAEAEVKKTTKSLRHFSEEDLMAVQRMTSAIVNKILHDPTIFLKRNGCRGGHSVSLDLTRKLFKLDEE